MNTDDKTPETVAPGDGERIAKVLSRAGVASRRDAERLILEGRVTVNGETITSPAVNVTPSDRLAVDGEVVGKPEDTRLWLYHKPAGLVTTEHDEEGRPTVFDDLPEDMPRVMSVGRLDLTSEGLLLLTNDGEVKRKLELPSTGWSRRYRVRIHGTPTNEQLEPLRQGVTVDGIDYQPMEVSIDRQQGTNAWLSVTLREGKNREIRRVMEHLGFTVNRLIRVSFGPFQLGELPVGDVEEVRARIVRDQLGLGKKPEPVTRTRKKPAPEEMPEFDDESEDRPERDRLATRRPEGATVKRELKPRAPGARKPRSETEEAPRPRATKPARKGAVPSAFAKPRTWMRADEEEARAAREREAAEESPREERRPYGDKPRSSGYKSHGDRPPREGGEDRPRGRSSGFRSHSDDRGERPRYPRGEGDRPARGFGDRERPARAEGDRGPRRYGDDDRRPPRRFEGDSDRPRSPRPPREGGDRPDRPYKPRPPHEGEEDRPRRAYKPREGGDDRAARPYKPRREGEGDRPPRPYKPREGGDDRAARPYKPRREGEGDRPARAYQPRREGDDSRPARGFKPRREGGEDRPPRSFKPRREGDEGRPPRSFGPRGDRPEGGRPPRKGPPREGGPKGRPYGGRPSGPKPRKG